MGSRHVDIVLHTALFREPRRLDTCPTGHCCLLSGLDGCVVIHQNESMTGTASRVSPPQTLPTGRRTFR